MAYEKELSDCRKYFRAYGLPFPEVCAYETSRMLSRANKEQEVYVGWVAKVLDAVNLREVERTILHEMCQIFVKEYRPPASLKELFGDEEDWKDEESTIRALGFPLDDDYISQYARTHPRNDLAETMVHVLRHVEMWDPKTGVVYEKVKAVRKWFKELC